MKITWGFYYWPIWILVLFAAFLGPEIYALVTNVKNTLSDFARYELHVGVAFHGPTHVSLAWWASIVVWAGFVAWITPHIWWGVTWP
jgi:hypothetical protein